MTITMPIDIYMLEHKDNLTIEGLVNKFKVSIPTVYRHMRLNGVKVRKEKRNQRREEMMVLKDSGKTYQEIADMYKISRQRVEQIINNHN